MYHGIYKGVNKYTKKYKEATHTSDRNHRTTKKIPQLNNLFS